MSDPKVLDFSAPAEEAVTVVFPDGETTCELPTADQLTLPALQFLTANGEEWGALLSDPKMTPAKSKRFDHLNEQLIDVLLDAPKSAIKTLSQKQKARIIMSFMTASPDLQGMIQELVEAETEKAPTTAS